MSTPRCFAVWLGLLLLGGCCTHRKRAPDPPVYRAPTTRTVPAVIVRPTRFTLELEPELLELAPAVDSLEDLEWLASMGLLREYLARRRAQCSGS